MKINTQLRTLLCIIAIAVFGTPYSLGQRVKNNIYLFDCTGSMKTNGLWEPAKAALDATISTQASIPGSQFCVIPFGNDPYQNFSFDSSQYSAQKSAITEAFDKYIREAKYTHISDVLRAGFDKVDPRKENKIYLLTDGLPNGGDSPELVARTITEWCANHRNCRLFYVALTNGVLNPVIQRAIDACSDAFIVQCEDKVIPQIADISSNAYTNLEELSEPCKVSFSIPGKYGVSVESNDDLFDVTVRNNSTADGNILLSVAPKDGMDIARLHQILQGEEYTFPISIQCTDRKYFIANPNVTVHVLDKIPSKLTLANGGDELSAGGAKWYDSFLWSNAAPDKTVSWDLSPVFKNELPDSQLELQFQTEKGGKADFRAWFNGQPVSNGDILLIEPGKAALLEVQFNHDATTGDREFSLTPVGVSSLDFINEQPITNYDGLYLQTKYSVGWNPLKTFLFWFSILLAAALVLWLTILKRIFFPTIKMPKVTMTGPDSYYASKKIKGARKVILTNKRKSQNILSRIFTGEVRYIKADHFSSELAITPVGRKKKVKLTSQGKPSANSWDIFPSSIFSQYSTGSITNRKTNDKTGIEFS